MKGYSFLAEQWQSEEELLLDESNGEVSHLVLHNDDFNTFDFVISCLMEICKHEQYQAEQCAILVHYKGKATVKTAGYEVLNPMKQALIDRGLSASIETEEAGS